MENLNLNQLEEVNGGENSNYNFGHKVGSSVRWVWDGLFGPGTPFGEPIEVH